jgi:hypothetical protein
MPAGGSRAVGAVVREKNVAWGVVAAAPVAADTGMTSPGPPGSDAVAHPAAPDSRHETGPGTISS